MSTDKKKTLLDLMDEMAPLEEGVVAWDDAGPGGGFTVSLANMADALGLSVPEVRALMRRFELNLDPRLARSARFDRDEDAKRYRPGVIEALRKRMAASSSEASSRAPGHAAAEGKQSA